MLMGLCVVLALAGVALTGGDLRRLADLQVQAKGLLYLALAVQVLITDFLTTWPRPVLVVAHLLTYAAAALIVWRNRRLPGLPLLAVGAACNGLAIAANGGTLPASAAALRQAGIRIDPADFSNSGVLAHPRLAWLGDVFAVPASWPLSNVFSLGDVLIVLGATWCLHRVCHQPHEPANTLHPAAA